MLSDWLGRIRAYLAALAGPYLRRAAATIDPLVGQARSRIQKLEPREKLLLKIAGGLVAVLLAYYLVYVPIISLGAGLEDRIAARQHDLRDVRRLANIYMQAKADLTLAEHRTVPNAKDFSLFSVVEGTLSKSVGREKIGSITPGTDRKLPDGFTEYNVQLKLNNVNLAQIVDALYGIGSQPVPIGVANLRIQRRNPDTHSYDVDITCVALAKNA